MENSTNKTEKEVLSMVHDLLKAGQAEQLQDIILDAFSGKFKDKREVRIKELNDRLQRVTDVVDAEIISTRIDDVDYPVDLKEQDSVKIEIITNMLS